MKLGVKSTVSGCILSDGSFRFLTLPGYTSRGNYSFHNLDIINHPVWTGNRPQAQTEITRFIERFNKG